MKAVGLIGAQKSRTKNGQTEQKSKFETKKATKAIYSLFIEHDIVTDFPAPEEVEWAKSVKFPVTQSPNCTEDNLKE